MLDSPEAFAILKAALLGFWDISPKQCKLSLLTILPKKGDLGFPGSYRGIVLLESLYKAAAIILHDNLKLVMELIDNEKSVTSALKDCPDGTFNIKMAIKKDK